MLVVRRIDLQLSVSPIADSRRLGLDTRLPNDSVTSGGHGGSDLCSPSNMRTNRTAKVEGFLPRVRALASAPGGSLPEDVCQSN